MYFGGRQGDGDRYVVVSTSAARHGRARGPGDWREDHVWRLPDLSTAAGRLALRAKARELGELGLRRSVFVSARAFGVPRRATEAALPSRVVWVDCDSRESAEALGRFGLAPDVVVRTGRPDGGGLHAYWILDRELAPEEHQPISARLAERLGADPAAARPTRPTRVPFRGSKKLGK